MEKSKSSKSDEASGDKDDDTKDKRKPPGFEDKDVSRFLQRIGEKSFITLFSQQRITMEMLMDLSHADLREVGVNTFGQRHKILTEVARLRRGRGQSSRCRLHPFNTACPGRKRKMENKNLCTKKMRLGTRHEVPVVISTASSIQPHTSVTTNSPSVCQTTLTASSIQPHTSVTTSSPSVCQTTLCLSSQTQTSSAIASSSLNVGLAANRVTLLTPIPTAAMPATITTGTSTTVATGTSTTVTTGTSTTVATAVISATSITGSVSTAISATQNPTTTVSSSSAYSLVITPTANLLTNTTTTPCHTIATSSVPCVSTSSTSLTGGNVLSVPVTCVHCIQNTISDEENNFLRYFLLAQLGTQALRILFDSYVYPVSLTNHLKKAKSKLKCCTADQKAILYPGAGGTVTSADFDTTLLYTLLRNTVNIAAPTSGWNNEPNPSDILEGDDVERIRFARNSLCHGKSSMDQSTFNSKWKSLSQVCCFFQ